MHEARFWDRQAKRFDKDPPRPDDDEAVRRALGYLRPQDRVLEIGCAAGATARALRPHVASLHGIDISREMVRRATQYAGDGLSFQHATIGQVAPDEYTAVVAFNVLHFMDLPGDLDRIVDLLPPGGVLLAQTPCLGDMPWYLRGTAGPVAKLLRLGLRQLRFEQLHAAVDARFDVVESVGRPPSQTWIAARRRTDTT